MKAAGEGHVSEVEALLDLLPGNLSPCPSLFEALRSERMRVSSPRRSRVCMSAA